MSTASRDCLLAIYLKDRLAGAAVGVELCRRLAGSNRDEEALAEPLERSLGGSVAGFDFRALGERAETQRERAHELHAIAAARALPSRSS
jgi:hypothetical protein